MVRTVADMKVPTILAAGLALLVVGVSSAAAQPAPAAQNTTIDVAIDNFAFAPAEITVPAGTTVSWANRQAVRHTTTADHGEWDSSILTSGQTFQLTLDTVGDFAYHCDVHPDMTGVVHVTASAGAATADPASEPAASAVPTTAPTPMAAPDPSVAPTPRSAYYGY